MAALPSNDELLQRFAASRSAEAFRELVNRYSGFVMAAARRQTGGDWHAAEDVAQRVFTALAQEAKKVRGESLGAWL
ncbi:MAG TPA: sigma factor, partial [Verrucomicrobiales bacterium]|nr:sigma factor [Verrucomicrobiales bacterium]